MARIAVIDSGHYLDFALLLASKGHVVYYSVDWFRAFPRLEDYATGMGYERIYPSFHKVIDPGVALANADYVVFTDVGLGHLASFLRDKGVKVWGASIPAQFLETDRFFMDSLMRKTGVGRPESRYARGFSELKTVISDMLSKYPAVAVKMNVFRGNMETQLISDVKDLDVIFSQTNLEPIQDKLTFIVEGKAEGVEWGIDTYFDGEGFVRPYAMSPESRGERACFVRLVDRSFVDDFILDKIEPWLKSIGFKGFLSIEFFVTKDSVQVTDYTIRLPYPGAGLLARLYENVDELIISSLDGHPVKPKYSMTYAVELDTYPESTERWQPYAVPSKYWDVFGKRWSVYVGLDGEEHKLLYVPGGTSYGSGIGLSNDSIRDAYDKAIEIASSINAPEKKYTARAWEIFEEKRKQIEEWQGRIY
jgi:phosphoribosylamine-glycine ligase